MKTAQYHALPKSSAQYPVELLVTQHTLGFWSSGTKLTDTASYVQNSVQLGEGGERKVVIEGQKTQVILEYCLRVSLEGPGPRGM